MQTSLNDDLLLLLKRYSVLRGSFTLSSGETSDVYVDVRATALRSEGLVAIGRALYHRVHQLDPVVRHVGGLAMGAIPITSAIAYHAGLSQIPDFYSVVVRKNAKGHGTSNLIEPSLTPSPGTPLIAIDDVVTTAGSTIQAIHALRTKGYTIEHALCIIDRESGGNEALAGVGVQLHSLFTLDEVLS